MSNREINYNELEQELQKPTKEKARALISKVDQHTKDLAFQGKVLNITLGFVIAVLATLFIGFIGFLYAYFQYASTSYNAYSDRIREYNDVRYKDLELRIEHLENGHPLEETDK